MRSEDRLIGALVAPILVFTSGCVGAAGSARFFTLEASPHPPVKDIPVPEGFRLADQSSEDWASGSIRFIRHRYVGRADKHAVRRFYREQMPLVRWAARSDANLHGRFSMHFGRGTDDCTVLIDSPASGRSKRVTVDVIVSPADRRTAED